MVTSSTVQQARQEIADRLREIRLDAGLTKRAVASRSWLARVEVLADRACPHAAVGRGHPRVVCDLRGG